MTRARENTQFLVKLQQEAQLQAQLHRRTLLPKQADALAAFVGNYPWQVLLVASGLTAGALELAGWWLT